MEVLTPAYGRDYKSKKALLEDLNADKDFVLNHYTGWTTKINKSDMINSGISQVQIRYKQLRNVTIVKLDKNKQLFV